MSEPVLSYAPLVGRMATAAVGEQVTLDGAGIHDEMTTAAADLTSTGVAVIAHAGHPDPGTPLTVVGERRMLHHLASAADVEIPVRLLAGIPLTAEQGDAILSRTVLAVLVAVS
ncbi:hypothetical protein [Arsenicicoccus dermatophilus]|uniref:hypothetical protein n=1 Tax=Arsenicicoccus dermatophilus TaxID=1076331 RepID=UPI001F4CE273|nr:hypothetical protein [Arsenicicoccus dermatophilus]MCH8612451.1 hypothetical protein [Arsenicicoccus dermatophilus]